ncbi:hypothetical protein CAL7102_07232 [Dulcicalothrix desertica PCC 7102]|nr:hypothetical protein CAL7102_07232 [Dulcicalothrix desertica PCC 7102]
MVYDSRNTRISRRDRDDDYNVVEASPSYSSTRRSRRDRNEDYNVVEVSPSYSSTRRSRRDRNDDYNVVEASPSYSSTRRSRRDSDDDYNVVEADLGRMRSLSESNEAPGYIRNMMGELVEASGRAEIHPSQAAYTIRRFNDGVPSTQEVYYHRDTENRLPNLAHELTHVRVQESFNRDYVNYTNPARGEVEDATFNEARDRMRNEDNRQNQRRVPKADNSIQVTLEDLQRITHEDKSLNGDQKRWIIQRLSYGMIQPHKEYDTVINQISVQLHDWEITSANSKVARKIERLATRLHNERMSGNRVISSTIRRPSFKPGMKPVEENKPSFLKHLFRG